MFSANPQVMLPTEAKSIYEEVSWMYAFRLETRGTSSLTTSLWQSSYLHLSVIQRYCLSNKESFTVLSLHYLITFAKRSLVTERMSIFLNIDLCIPANIHHFSFKNVFVCISILSTRMYMHHVCLVSEIRKREWSSAPAIMDSRKLSYVGDRNQIQVFCKNQVFS